MLVLATGGGYIIIYLATLLIHQFGFRYLSKLFC